jgi:hypothetical protein
MATPWRIDRAALRGDTLGHLPNTRGKSRARRVRINMCSRERFATCSCQATRLVTCGDCGATFECAEWSALAIIERIEPEAVRRLLRDWPQELRIEVRRCSRCGRAMASKCQIVQ